MSPITVKSIIQDAGGAISVGKACGVSYQAVQKWVANGMPRTEFSGETSYSKTICLLAEANGANHLVSELLDASQSQKLMKSGKAA